MRVWISTELTGRIGVTLVDYRDGIATLNRTRASITELEQDAETRAASLSTSEGSAEIKPFLHGWGKYVLIMALVFADWVANVPVFYELLPKDAAADRALQQLLESTEAYPIVGGLMRLGLRFLHSPEASILALTVVLAVGTRFNGHASAETRQSRATSAARPSVEAPSPVIAISRAPSRFIVSRSLRSSSVSPLYDSATITSSACSTPRSP
jgi:hypothetical protein